MLLTNHLYPFDWVISSFIETLDKRYPLDECLFWFWELVYTTDNIEDGLMCIASLFYPHSSEALVTYIRKKCDESLGIDDLAEKATRLSAIVVNLRRISKVNDGFVIQQSASDETVRPSAVYVNRLGETSTGFCLSSAVKKRNRRDVGFYLSKLLSQDLHSNQDGVMSKLWHDEVERLDLIAHSSNYGRKTCGIEPSRSKTFVTAPTKVISSLREIFSVLDDDKIDGYLKLRKTRLYRVRINPDTNHLVNTPRTVIAMTRKNWIKQVIEGIAWERRVAVFNGVVENGVPRFATELETTKFEEAYSLDFDELPLDIQLRSLPS